MTTTHLIVPGLHPFCSQITEDSAKQLNTPNLNEVFSYACVEQGITGFEKTLFNFAGLANQSGVNIARHAWEMEFNQSCNPDKAIVIASPVFSQIGMNDLVIHPTPITYRHDEKQAMVAYLNQHFDSSDLEDSEIHFYAGATFIYAEIPKSSLPKETVPLSEVLGKDSYAFVHSSHSSLQWNQLYNELQMLMHQCPVNQKKSLQGEPTANTLWLWGASSDDLKTAGNACNIGEFYCSNNSEEGDDEYINTMAMLCSSVLDIPANHLPLDNSFSGDKSKIVIYEKLHANVLSGDWYQCGEALKQLDKQLATASEWIKQGHSLTLYPCDGTVMTARKTTFIQRCFSRNRKSFFQLFQTT